MVSGDMEWGEEVLSVYLILGLPSTRRRIIEGKSLFVNVTKGIQWITLQTINQ
jgi:hypothetical protein